MHRMVDGVRVELTPEEEAEILAEWEANRLAMESRAWLDGRLREYPPIAAQLDMLFHDMKSGSTTWLDAVQAVKDKFPKP